MKARYIIIFLLSLFLITPTVSAKTLDCTTTLFNGSTGENVKNLQATLNKITTCNLDVDGIYGTLTKKCVTSFQQENALAVDGIVGINTCTKLNTITTAPKISSKRIFVTVSKANIRKSPTTSSPILATTSLGKTTKVVKEVGDWYKIKISKGYGYIRKDLVTKHVIIVDISDQLLYYYESGKNILSTPVVTGIKNSHDTPIGKYVLKKVNLERSRTLRGYNDDGSKYAAYVDYWMPFITERGIGFHDASWRSAKDFNATTYLNRGSHGCINMKPSAAKILFESITENTAVIVRK